MESYVELWGEITLSGYKDITLYGFCQNAKMNQNSCCLAMSARFKIGLKYQLKKSQKFPIQPNNLAYKLKTQQ